VELDDAIRGRRSVRLFKDEPVDREVVRELIELAVAAPSSHNLQPWHFYVATGEVRDRACEILSQTTLYYEEYLESLPEAQAEATIAFFASLGDAPVIVAVTLPSTEERLDQINSCVSAGGAIQNMQLAAYERGLGSCNITFSFWVRDELSELFGAPEDREIVSLVILGHPAEEAVDRGRDLDVITFLE
jgi:nitroreductase